MQNVYDEKTMHLFQIACIKINSYFSFNFSTNILQYPHLLEYMRKLCDPKISLVFSRKTFINEKEGGARLFTTALSEIVEKKKRN